MDTGARSRRIWLVFFLALAILLAAILKMAPSNGPADSDETIATPVRIEGRTSTDSAPLQPSPSPPLTSPALFSSAIPLQQRLPTLIERAESGDTQASCYVGIMLERCMRLPTLRRRVVHLETRASEASAGSEKEQRLINQLRTLESTVQVLNQSCSGISEPNEKSWKYLRAAAEAGSDSAVLAFATRPPLNLDQPLADIERWDEYKRDVPRYLRQSVSRGSIPALYLALGIYSGEDTIGAGGGAFVPRDPALALSYALVLEARLDNPFLRNRVRRQIDGFRAELRPSQIESAQKASDAMMIQAFPAHRRIADLADLAGDQSPESCVESK